MFATRLLKILCTPRQRGVKLGPEGMLSMLVANWLRELVLSGRYEILWFKVPNEAKRSYLHAAAMRFMGVVPGAPDFVICTGGKILFVELKAGRGRQSENQKIFQEWCMQARIDYTVATSVEEVKAAMKKNKML